MSRRADTPVPEINHGRETPPPNETKQAVETRQAVPPVEEVLIPKGQFFPTKAELDAARDHFLKHGKCPECGLKIGRGIAGHLSKCLRLSKFKTASTKTT